MSADLEEEGDEEKIRTVLNHTFAALALVLMASNLMGVILLMQETAPWQLAELQSFIEVGLFGVLAIMAVGAATEWKEDLLEAIERARSNAE